MARFEARELKPYAEPVTADRLIVDTVYFSVQFLDEDMLVPVVETLVFIGREESDRGERTCIFQDADSYRAGIGRESADAENALFYAQPEHQLKHIFEYDKALDSLLACSLRRAEARTLGPLARDRRMANGD